MSCIINKGAEIVNFIPPDLNFFTFSELANRWNITEDRIECYLKEGKLKEFEYENLNIQAPVKERKRLARLKDVLNRHARKDISNLIQTGPLKPNTIRLILTPEQRASWFKIKKSDQAFEKLLEHEGFNIDCIRIVIPTAEVKRFEARYSKIKTVNTEVEKDTDEPLLNSSKTKTQDSNVLLQQEILCKDLRMKGHNNQQIARELKKQFPNIYPSRIGRLVTEVPGVHVSTDTYRRRGNLLLNWEYKRKYK